MPNANSSRERNVKQFYIYAIRTLHFAALAGHSERTLRGKKEILFSELPSSDARRLHSSSSPYTCDKIFTVLDYEIVVQNEELADALSQLTEHRRNIILLKYFLKWTDEKIAKALESRRTTINGRRYAALKTLRKLYEDNDGG